ncbi:hypothetical protein GCM10027598_22840 [Amycolatopsis oliviviridis]|uniref:Uncharacterized protein n=1 Tax=Amycolatopsis oliviviridis TaxID=1471590 RepID=A0ABQ3LIZ9_9PSEU|nr:hypothetical protein [Amycolatopsis oliviviridis]GHH15690.1 hypothetical protein GCM10017790_30480 [Amycolatopsis oliviviridis]
MTGDLGRRAAFGMAATAGGALLAGGTAGATESTADSAMNDKHQVSPSFTVVDKRGRQRFLLDSRKPPLIVDGQTYPPERRSGPENGSYLIFNDETGDEKGGLLVHPTGGHIAFDYPHAVDGINLSLSAKDGVGGAGLTINGIPDPDAGPGVRATPRALFGCHTAFGAQLALCDSQGRPRIVLQVDENDRPTIKILDGDGKTVNELA